MSERRFAILIGNSKFPNEDKLTDLRLPGNDVEGLREVLESAELCSFSKVIALKEEGSDAIRRSIAEVLVDTVAEDLVLIYYSGHGKVDLKGRLHLATSDTRLRILPETSLVVEHLLDRLSSAKSKKKFLILDCCYSGAAANAFFKGDPIEEEIARTTLEGTCVLTSSTDLQPSIEKTEDLYSLMTKHMIDGIRQRKAVNEFGLTSVSDLFAYVKRGVTAESEQVPTIHVKNIDLSEWVIAGSINNDERERLKIGYKLVGLGNQIDDEIVLEAHRLIRLKNIITKDQREKRALLVDLSNDKITVADFLTKWAEINASQKRLGEYFDAAEKGEAEENWDVAEANLKAIITIDPEHVEATERLREIEKHKALAGKYDEASQLLAKGQLSEGLSVLQALESLSPGYKDVPDSIERVRSKLAALSTEASERRRLKDEADKSKRKQRELRRLYQEGRGSYDSGKWKQALERFSKVEALSPNYQETAAYLEEIRLFIKSDSAASEARVEVLAEIRDQLKALPVRNHNVSKVAARVRSLNSRIEEELLTLFKQANEFYEQRNWQEALKNLRVIQSVDPNYINVVDLNRRVEQEIHKQAHDQSVPSIDSELTSAVSSTSQAEVERLYLEAREDIRKEDWDAAVEKLETAQRVFPSNTEIGSRLRIAKEQQQVAEFYWAGKSHFASKDWQAALNMFSRVLAVEPYYKDVEELVNLATNKGKVPVTELIKEPVKASLVVVTGLAFVGIIFFVIVVAFSLLHDSSKINPTNPTKTLDGVPPNIDHNLARASRPPFNLDQFLQQQQHQQALADARKVAVTVRVRTAAVSGKSEPLEGADLTLYFDKDTPPYERKTNAEGIAVAEAVPCGRSIKITVTAEGKQEYSKQLSLSCRHSSLNLPAITLLNSK